MALEIRVTKMRACKNMLALDHKPKGIPYGGAGEMRPDGDANYGFKDIKGRPDLLPTIPELARDPALLEAIGVINQPNTGLFSIGCASSLTTDSDGFYLMGYIEFAFNSASYVQDPSRYFSLFFQFDRALSAEDAPIIAYYLWELQPAAFTDANIGGYSCSVNIKTSHMPTEQQATMKWEEALGLLSVYLSTVPADAKDLLYGSNVNSSFQRRAE
jgi:hypothetical protein